MEKDDNTYQHIAEMLIAAIKRDDNCVRNSTL